VLSVIIPAHDEEIVIGRGLRAILAGVRPDELEVIVVCNGCTDRTAEVAREFGPPVRVLEVPAACKTAALNAADAAATGFPRFYVDADVVLDLQSIRAMAARLERGDVHYATPTLRLDLSQSSWAVRTFYRVWTQLPYNQVGGQVGTGVYALSRVGRERFDRFPDVINDDGFVRFSFAPHERTAVVGAVSRVTPPCTLAALIRAKTRVRAGHRQLQRGGSPVAVADRRAAEPIWRWGLRRPDLWPALPIYAAITVWTRARRPARGNRWGRDDSRTGAAGATAMSGHPGAYRSEQSSCGDACHDDHCQ